MPIKNKLYVCPPESQDLIYEPNRSADIPGIITKDSPIYKIFKEKGWIWGGESFETCVDLHHFEKRIPELSHWYEIYKSDTNKTKGTLFGGQKMVTLNSTTDLRMQPYPAYHPTNPISWHDNLQESQLLLGDHVTVLEDHRYWLYVYAQQQKEFRDGDWQPVLGWIQKKEAIPVDEFPDENIVVKIPWTKIYSQDHGYVKYNASCGTKLRATGFKGDWWTVELPDGTYGIIKQKDVNNVSQLRKTSNEIRNEIIEIAHSFLETPYLWNGRSAYNSKMNNQCTGADCASLVNLCYLVVDMDVPVHAPCLYQNCKPLKHGNDLQKGDLIFLALTSNPHEIIHVMIYAENDNFIDAFSPPSSAQLTPQQKHGANTVRKITGQQFLEKPIYEISSGEHFERYTVYFGTYFGQ
jgi:cell wall-associated NlpC family hydrolase